MEREEGTHVMEKLCNFRQRFCAFDFLRQEFMERWNLGATDIVSSLKISPYSALFPVLRSVVIVFIIVTTTTTTTTTTVWSSVEKLY
jgi:hypothetical protein